MPSAGRAFDENRPEESTINAEGRDAMLMAVTRAVESLAQHGATGPHVLMAASEELTQELRERMEQQQRLGNLIRGYMRAIKRVKRVKEGANLIQNMAHDQIAKLTKALDGLKLREQVLKSALTQLSEYEEQQESGPPSGTFSVFNSTLPPSFSV